MSQLILNKYLGILFLIFCSLILLMACVPTTEAPSEVGSVATEESAVVTVVTEEEESAVVTVVTEEEETMEVSEDSKYGGILVFGVDSDTPDISPYIYNGGSARDIKGLIYSKLVMYNPEGEVVPELAESYEWISPTLLEFKLRQGVLFHDGTPLTSEDVKFTFETIMNTTGAYLQGQLSDAIEEIKTPDDLTVQLVLKAPNASLISLLTLSDGANILSKAYVEAGHDLNESPMGSGPFMFKRREPGAYIELEKNPNYYIEGLPYVDEVKIVAYRDQQARVNALLSAGADYINFVPLADQERLDALPDIAIVRNLTSYNHILFNLNHPPFDNPLVREAIAWAVDRPSVTASAHVGQGQPITGGILQQPWDCPELEDTYGYDPEKAKALLEEAGYPDGFEATLLASGDHSWHYLSAEVTQQYLQDIGIDVVLDLQDWQTTVAREANSEFDFRIQQGPLFIPDPDALSLKVACGSSLAQAIGFCDETLDDLLAQGRQEIDPEKRHEIYCKAEARILELLPMVYLSYGKSAAAGIRLDRVEGAILEPWPGVVSVQANVYLIPRVWVNK